MTPISQVNLERVKELAGNLTGPLSEIWSMESGAKVSITSHQAEELRAEELVGSLSGYFWLIEIESAGSFSGKQALLVDRQLVASQSFGAIIDNTLNAASASLSKMAGGVVAAERVSLREVPGERAVELLAAMFGDDELVVVSSRGSIGEQQGEIAVFVSSELALQASGQKKQESKKPPKKIETVESKLEDAVLERARNISIKLSVEIGSRKMTVSELLELRVGASLMLMKDCISPLNLMAGSRVLAKGDVVTMNGQFGLRIRG